MAGNEPNWVMWAGTLNPTKTSFEDRLLASAAAGCTRMSVPTYTVLREGKEGLRIAAEWSRFARSHGVEPILDSIVTWLPGRSDETTQNRPNALFPMDDILAAAEALGAVSMTANAFSIVDLPLEGRVGCFATLCDRTAAFGCQVHLEFIPSVSIPTLAEAWEIVRLADRANGGLVMDAWHFFMGDPDFDLLATIPGERIFTTQWNDAMPLSRRVLWSDHSRRGMPGSGSFDLPRLVRVLRAVGGLTWAGPEVMADELDALPTAQAAKRAMDGVRSFLAGVK